MTSSREKKVDLQAEAHKIIHKVHRLLPLGSDNTGEPKPKIAYALALRERNLSKMDFSYLSEETKNEMKVYESHWKDVKEPQGENRAKYFRQLVENVKMLNVTYGLGNCHPMAELSFIEAVHRQSPDAVDRMPPCDLSFVCFSNKHTQKIEIVCAFLLGSLSESGSIVGIAWQGKNVTPVFYWRSNGDVPETTKLGLNRVNTFLSLKAKDHAERKLFFKILKDADYANWTKMPARKKILKQINNAFDTPPPPSSFYVALAHFKIQPKQVTPTSSITIDKAVNALIQARSVDPDKKQTLLAKALRFHATPIETMCARHDFETLKVGRP